MPYDVDRSLLPTRRWVEGWDGGRNYGTRVLFALMSAGALLAAIPVIGEDPTWRGVVATVPIVLASLTLASLARGVRLVWPDRSPRLHATLASLSAADTAGVAFAPRRVSRVGTGLMAAAFATGGVVIVGSAWNYRHLFTWQENSWWFGLGLTSSVIGLWLAHTLRRAALHGRPGEMVLTSEGVVMSSYAGERLLGWENLESADLTTFFRGRGRTLSLVPTHADAWWDLTAGQPRDPLQRMLHEGHPTQLLLEEMLDHPSVVTYAVRYYRAHPEHRDELSDDRSLKRLRAVLRGPTYADS